MNLPKELTDALDSFVPVTDPATPVILTPEKSRQYEKDSVLAVLQTSTLKYTQGHK